MKKKKKQKASQKAKKNTKKKRKTEPKREKQENTTKSVSSKLEDAYNMEEETIIGIPKSSPPPKEKKQKQNIAKLQRDVALVERQLHDSKERFTNLLKTCEKEHIKEANESKEVQAVLEDDLKAYQTFLNDQLDSCQEVSGKRKTLTK